MRPESIPTSTLERGGETARTDSHLKPGIGSAREERVQKCELEAEERQAVRCVSLGAS